MTPRLDLHETTLAVTALGEFRLERDSAPIIGVVRLELAIGKGPVDIWPALPPEVRRAILAQIEAEVVEQAVRDGENARAMREDAA